MKKSKIIMAAAFMLAIGSAFVGKSNSKVLNQYNFKDPDHGNACTFLSNTDPCGGGTHACTADIPQHTGVVIYQSTTLDCTNVDMTQQ